MGSVVVRLLFEYMFEVYFDKAKVGYNEIMDIDFHHFMQEQYF